MNVPKTEALKQCVDATVVENACYRGDYFHITFEAPSISPHVMAGHFVHLQLPEAANLVLRRPFSIFDTDPDAGTLSLIYKVVGAGSMALSQVGKGELIGLIGPCGKPFPLSSSDAPVVIVAGGYGCASTYMVAKGATSPGVCLLGARSAEDIIVQDRFVETGFDVQISTDDGSMGLKGRVTELLLPQLDKADVFPDVYACGPNAMLKAVGDICIERGGDAALSLDLPMCCGVGACFTCVMRCKADNADGWEYIRTCIDGPVLMASQVVWDA